MNDGLDFLFDGRTAAQPERKPDDPNRWRHRLGRLGLTGLILLSAGTVGVLATGYVTGTDLTNRVSRVGEVFDGSSDAERPAAGPATTSGRTILAIGAELRAPEPASDTSPADEPADKPQVSPASAPAGEPAEGEGGTGSAGDRAAAVMLIRFDPGHHAASVISIPDRTGVDAPGHGRTTIRAAYAIGGPALLVRTVEQLTSVRVDHFMVIDFDELAPIVDVLDGVDVTVAAAISDGTGVQFRAGVNRLDGARARAYLRQSDVLPEDALDRVQRQQNLLRAVLAKAASVRTDVKPLEGYRLLDAVTRAVSVDDGFTRDELRELAHAAAGLKTGSIWFLTAPTRDSDSDSMEPRWTRIATPGSGSRSAPTPSPSTYRNIRRTC